MRVSLIPPLLHPHILSASVQATGSLEPSTIKCCCKFIHLPALRSGAPHSGLLRLWVSGMPAAFSDCFILHQDRDIPISRDFMRFQISRSNISHSKISHFTNYSTNMERRNRCGFSYRRSKDQLPTAPISGIFRI